MVEEIIAPTIFLEVMGFVFPVPANWNVLIMGEDTGQVDIVDAGSLTTNQFTALVGGPAVVAPLSAKVRVVDYKQEFVNVSPSLAKHNMLCHPISDKFWITISASDVYKYVKDAIVGDFF